VIYSDRHIIPLFSEIGASECNGDVRENFDLKLGNNSFCVYTVQI